MFRYRQQLRPRPIGQNAEPEYERHRQPREQIADHRLVRPYPGPRQQRARRLRMLRAQQVEPCHDRAHQSRRGHSRTRRPRADGRLAQALALLRDAGKAAVERVAPAQRLPDRDKATRTASAARPAIRSSALSQYGSQSSSRKSSTRVLRIAPGRAQISNRAILTMIAMPVSSIRIASPTSISPRMSVNSGAI